MSDFDLSEWDFVWTNGECLCGRRQAGRRLVSLQGARISMTPEATPDGGARPRMTVITYPWIVDEIIVPEGELRIAVEACTGIDPRGVAIIIQATEKLKIQQRAQRAGLTLARSH
jgi:hypothetical protein